MKNATHQVPGLAAVRKSPRTYTHATVVTTDRDWEIAHLMPKEIKFARNYAISNHAYYVAIAATKVGEFAPHRHYPTSAEEHSNAVAIVSEFPTAAAYADHREAEIRASYAAKPAMEEGVLAWHMSLDAARKFASSKSVRQHYVKAEVREVVRTEAGAKAA